MTCIGYARVSAGYQHLAAQVDALESAGCERVFADAASGIAVEPPGLAARGVLLRSLREGIHYSTPAGKMLAGVFAALAGYERELMHERAAAARAAARARGKHTGRPPRLTGDQVRQVRALRAGGEAVAALAATFAVSRATIYRALHQDLDDGAEVEAAGSGPAIGTVGVAGVCLGKFAGTLATSRHQP